jgi:glycosyltransferase involved in cell wall biosynthesis
VSAGGPGPGLRVSFIVPAKNEAPTIQALLDDIARECAALAPFEVVYVDDGSTDDTPARLRAARATRPWLRAVRHAESCGKSAALLSGARAARAPILVTLDGDGQNDPRFVPAMVAVLDRDPATALVAGQRLRRGESDSAFKKLQSTIANGARKALLRDGTRDTACGLKAIRRDVFLALPYFDTLHRFFPALVAREGHGIAHADVVDRPRTAGVSHYGMLDRLLVGIPDLFGVWWLIRRRKRVPRIEETL